MPLFNNFQKELCRMVMPAPDNSSNPNIGWIWSAMRLTTQGPSGLSLVPERMDEDYTGGVVATTNLTLNLLGSLRNLQNKVSIASAIVATFTDIQLAEQEAPSGAGSVTQTIKSAFTRYVNWNYQSGDDIIIQIKINQRFS